MTRSALLRSECAKVQRDGKSVRGFGSSNKCSLGSRSDRQSGADHATPCTRGDIQLVLQRFSGVSRVESGKTEAGCGKAASAGLGKDRHHSRRACHELRPVRGPAHPVSARQGQATPAGRRCPEQGCRGQDQGQNQGRQRLHDPASQQGADPDAHGLQGQTLRQRRLPEPGVLLLRCRHGPNGLGRGTR